MNISQLSREEIEASLKKNRKETESSESIRIIFSPRKINSKNLKEVSSVFSQLGNEDYHTVVVVETHEGEAEKKLPMPSFKFLETPYGKIETNDQLRNDFADEDDDFFINDDAFDEDVSLHDQLIMLQHTLDNFKVLSIQITDERSFYVKELAAAMEEILASKNVLILFCCDLKSDKIDELKRVVKIIESDNESELMNYLNGGTSSVEGVGAFISGLLVARKWGLRIYFGALHSDSNHQTNLLTGFADMQKQAIFK